MVPTKNKFLLLIFFFCAYSSQYNAQSQNINQMQPQFEKQIESQSLKSLSEKSEMIIIGKVTKQTSKWNEDKSFIYTNATLRVDEFIKGNNYENFIDVSYLGGEVDDIGELYSDVAKFNDDEEVMLFLKKDKNKNVYNIIDGKEGKINIVNDEMTHEKVTNSRHPINSLKAQIKKYIMK